MAREDLTQDILCSLLHYDSESGIFTWLKREETDRFVKAWNARYAGTKAGCISSSRGYCSLVITLNGKKSKFELHRLAWLYVYGNLPPQIDHENRIKTDNRIVNLRIATYSLNGHNVGLTKRNKSGAKGINWHKASKKWIVRMACNGKIIYLGTYDDLEEAKRVYAAASVAYAKEFSIHYEEAA